MYLIYCLVYTIEEKMHLKHIINGGIWFKIRQNIMKLTKICKYIIAITR